jgi:uncharacterized membrane protein (DUF106 family)
LLDGIIEMYYGFLSVVFSPVLGLPVIYAVIIMAMCLSFTTTMIYKFGANQEEIKKIREEQKALNAKVREVQKEDPEKANKLMGEVLKLTNKQMKMNMKPMMLSMIVVVGTFPWLGTVFVGPVLTLPFTIPFLGAEFGWFAVYIVVAILFGMGLRKKLGMV